MHSDDQAAKTTPRACQHCGATQPDLGLNMTKMVRKGFDKTGRKPFVEIHRALVCLGEACAVHMQQPQGE